MMSIYIHLGAFIIALITTYLTTPKAAQLAKRLGKTGIDIHKPEKPIVPSLGGLAIVLGIITGAAPALLTEFQVETVVFISVTLICCLIGLLDDFKVLPGLLKMGLTLLSITPIVAGWLMFPDKISLGRPTVPIIGRLRLTIMYWLLLPLAVAGPANAVNMLEVLNGVMPITCSIAVSAMIVAAVILGKNVGVLLGLILLGALIGYLPHNKYPAKVFSGDTGSLAVGGAIGSLAVISGLEFVTMVALMPHILNAFLVVTSVKGFKERRTIKIRPVIVDANGGLTANKAHNAPITLTRLILLFSGRMREPEVVRVLTGASLWAALLAVISALMIKG